jgi:hypothetical protein
VLLQPTLIIPARWLCGLAVTVGVSTKELTGGPSAEKKRVMMVIGLAVCHGTGGILLRGQAQEKESDPVKLTPRMYKVRLDNAYVRVL